MARTIFFMSSPQSEPVRILCASTMAARAEQPVQAELRWTFERENANDLAVVNGGAFSAMFMANEVFAHGGARGKITRSDFCRPLVNSSSSV